MRSNLFFAEPPQIKKDPWHWRKFDGESQGKAFALPRFVGVWTNSNASTPLQRTQTEASCGPSLRICSSGRARDS